MRIYETRIRQIFKKKIRRWGYPKPVRDELINDILFSKANTEFWMLYELIQEVFSPDDPLCDLMLERRDCMAEHWKKNVKKFFDRQSLKDAGGIA